MTSALGVGRGAPKSRQKEQNQLISERDKGGKEGIKKSENFADFIKVWPYLWWCYKGGEFARALGFQMCSTASESGATVHGDSSKARVAVAIAHAVILLFFRFQL